MQYNNLTYNKVDIISSIRNVLNKSSNVNDVKKQYNKITKPTHMLSAELLKMITDYKEISFVNNTLQKNNFIDIMLNLIKNLLTNNSHYSNNHKKLILNSKIIF